MTLAPGLDPALDRSIELAHSIQSARREAADLELEASLARSGDFSIRAGLISSSVEPEFALALIYGVGVIAVERGLRPVLFVHRSLTGKEPRLLQEVEIASAVVRAGLTYRSEPEDIVVGIPPPRLTFCPGDTVASAKTGTLGSRVTDTTGAPSILTAGHVAGNEGSIAVAPGAGVIGEVTYSRYPEVVARGQSTQDVALIRLRNPQDGCERRFDSVSDGSLYDEVSIVGSGPRGSSFLSQEVMLMAIPGQPGALTDLWLTAEAISLDGDSGAAVHKKDTTELVGHIVGLVEGYASMVQKGMSAFAACGASL